MGRVWEVEKWNGVDRAGRCRVAAPRGGPAERSEARGRPGPTRLRFYNGREPRTLTLADVRTRTCEIQIETFSRRFSRQRAQWQFSGQTESGIKSVC